MSWFYFKDPGNDPQLPTPFYLHLRMLDTGMQIFHQDELDDFIKELEKMKKTFTKKKKSYNKRVKDNYVS